MEQNNDQQAPISIDDQDIADVPGFSQAEEGKEIDWKAEAEKYKGIADRRTTVLRKVKDGTKKPTPANDAPANQPKKGELDYGQKAYLNSLGFKDAADHAYVQGVMTDTGKDLETVLAIPVVQAELTRLGEERTTKAAQPPANERGGATGRDSVEYWLNKGELPPEDQVELRRKVVNARITKEKDTSKFGVK